MKVIAVCGQKGGSGKTTVVVNLATEACYQGKSVTLIDIDAQATAFKWGQTRTAAVPVVVSAQAAVLSTAIQSAASSDYVFVDSAGKVGTEFLAAARVADLVLLPLRPTHVDVEALFDAIELLKIVSRQQQIFAVFNAVLPRETGGTGRLAEAADKVRSLGVAVAPCSFAQRVAYADSMIDGRAAQEHDPGSLAATEVEMMYRWMEEVLGG